MDDGPLVDLAGKKIDLPADYEIPESLISRWEALPADQRFVPTLPRLAWDRLYQSIEQANHASMGAVNLAFRLLNSVGKDNKDEANEALTKFAAQQVLTRNALRQFQEMVMIAAVGEGAKDGR